VSRLEGLAAELLGTLGNAGLKLDPLSEARLRELEGSSVRFDVHVPGRDVPLHLRLIIERASLNFELGDETPANAIVRGSPADLVAWLSGRPASGLTFSGDEALLARLGNVFEQYQPDLEAPLGRLIGAEGSAAVLGYAEAALAAARSALEAVGDSAGESARQHYVGNDELHAAVEAAESLQLKLDRLSARAARLEELLQRPGAD
jgi:ubiquinone biosynthesis protein UbiJ